MSAQSDVGDILAKVTGLDGNRVANFSYTDAAFDGDVVAGSDVFNVSADMNVPTKNGTDYNPTVLAKGARTQAASIPKNGLNHFFGRISYNLNKLVQKMVSFVSIFMSSLAHNCNEYDASASYAIGDTCYVISTAAGVTVKTTFIRTSSSPTLIKGIAPTDTDNWSPVKIAVAANATSADNAVKVATITPGTLGLALLALGGTLGDGWAAALAAQCDTRGIVLENRTSDPTSPAVGRIWLRTDL
jgi:hypothetical protein